MLNNDLILYYCNICQLLLHGLTLRDQVIELLGLVPVLERGVRLPVELGGLEHQTCQSQLRS
jgi:hypothetical protein